MDSPYGLNDSAETLAFRIIENAKNKWNARQVMTATWRHRGQPGVRELYTRARRDGYASPRDELIGFFRGPWCRFLWESITEVPIEYMWKEFEIDSLKECKIRIRSKTGDTQHCIQFIPRVEGED